MALVRRHEDERPFLAGCAHALEALPRRPRCRRRCACGTPTPKSGCAQREHPRLGIGGDFAQRRARALLQLLRRGCSRRARSPAPRRRGGATAQHLLLDARTRLCAAGRAPRAPRPRAGRPAASAAAAPARRSAEPLLFGEKLRQLERLADQHLRIFEVGEEHATARARVPGASCSPKIRSTMLRASRGAHRRRAPHQRQRHEDDRPAARAALALDANQLLDVGAAKIAPAPSRRASCGRCKNKSAESPLPHHLGHLGDRRAAPLAPQPSAPPGCARAAA